MNDLILKELEIVKEEYPDFANRVIDAIDNSDMREMGYRDCLEEKRMKNYYQELEMVYKEVPDFASKIVKAIEEGKINGSDLVKENNTGCFYGHIHDLNSLKAHDHVMKVRFEIHDADYYTPIESMIIDANPGDTHLTHPETLGKLRLLCLEFMKKQLEESEKIKCFKSN